MRPSLRRDGPFETARVASPGPVAVHNMDDEGPPLSSPLPLSQPAVQAPIDNPDAPPSPESTGADEGTPASDNPQLGEGGSNSGLLKNYLDS